MLQTLHLIDLDRYQKFGWNQASIWAVEEPESSLHTSLECQLAKYLYAVVSEKGGRLQTFATSHSDIILQYSDASYFVQKTRFPSPTSPLSTKAERHSKKEILKLSARMGITRWTDPILLYPLEPIVLVEGKFDREFLKEGQRLNNDIEKYVIVTLEDLLENNVGGKDSIERYLKSRKDVIKAKNTLSPIIVLLDWEEEKKYNELKKIFDDKDPFKVLLSDKSKSNPILDESFKGIEKFSSERMLNVSKNIAPNLIGLKDDGQCTIFGKNYEAFKGAINNVVKKGLEPSDLIFLNGVLKQIDEVLN